MKMYLQYLKKSIKLDIINFRNALTYIYKITQFDVVVILYWGDAFLCGNFLPQVDEPWKYKIQHRKHAKEKMLCV